MRFANLICVFCLGRLSVSACCIWNLWIFTHLFSPICFHQSGSSKDTNFGSLICIAMLNTNLVMLNFGLSFVRFLWLLVFDKGDRWYLRRFYKDVWIRLTLRVQMTYRWTPQHVFSSVFVWSSYHCTCQHQLAKWRLFNLLVPCFPLDCSRILASILLLRGMEPGNAAKVIVICSVIALAAVAFLSVSLSVKLWY